MESPPPERDSGVRISLAVSIEYTRKRAIINDRWEARISTVALLLIGGAIALALVWLIVPRVLDALGSL